MFVNRRNKEPDNETSNTYFGARYYDSELSGWLSVDPMSDKYPSLSPYCYSADNPVVLVDPNGENFTNFVDEDGNLIKHIDDGSNAVFRQTGSGTGKHYTFIGYDDVFFLDENFGWAVGGSFSVVLTTDGGNTWDIKTPGKIDIYIVI